MKMKAWIAAALLVTSVAASAAPVEVARGDWSGIPLLKERDGNRISAQAVDRIHRALAEGKCSIPGQSAKRLDLNVPFLVQFGAQARVERIVLQKLDCAAVETVLGSVLADQAERGKFISTGENDAGWYRSELRITSQ
jgi:hypothetical protein